MKGKYAASAARRREVETAEQSEAAYRRQIVRLTKERDEARAQRDGARKLWKQDIRVLEARVREGTSDRVEALRLELERQRALCAELTHIHKSRTAQWARAINRLITIIMDVKGVTRVEAVEVLTSWNLDPLGAEFGRAGVGVGNIAHQVRAAATFADETPPEGAGEPPTVVSSEVFGRLGRSHAGQDVGAVMAIQRARGVR